MFAGREAALQCAVPESRVWVVAPEMNLGEKTFRVVWDLAVRRGLLPVEAKSRREHWIEFENGSKIEVRTEENPDQLIGEGVDLMVIDEAARLGPTTWEELLKPTLMDKPGRAIFTSTPRGENFFHGLWAMGQMTDRYPEWRSWKLPSRINPINLPSDLDEVDQRIKDDPVANAHLRQEYWADFVTYRGIVFPEFSRAIHVRREPFVVGQKTRLWVDPGITNPYACLLVQVTGDETVRVLDEIYKVGMTTPEIIIDAQRKWPYAMFDGGVVGNNPNPELEVVVDEAAADHIAGWRIAGYQAYGAKPPLRTGIEVYRRMLRDPFRRADIDPDTNPLGIWPRITFDPKCENSIAEHNRYHYPEETRRRADLGPTEVPVDSDNHSISACRYGLFAEWPELFNEYHPQTDLIYASTDEMAEALGIDLARTRIDSGYAPEYENSMGRFYLGD
jgi:hypothetical protein